MKFQQIIILIGVLVFSSLIGNAQCDIRVNFDAKTQKNLTGSIDVDLNMSKRYVCDLYEYKGGNKELVESKNGNSIEIRFQNLAIDRFYRVEISFIETNELLCRSYVSELIQFKN